MDKNYKIKAGNVIHMAKCLISKYKGLGLVPNTTHSGNCSIFLQFQSSGCRGTNLEVQGHSWLKSNNSFSLSYMRLFFGKAEM